MSRSHLSDNKKKLLPVTLVLAFVTALVFYYLLDPAESRFMPQCIFHKFTGLDCPGCGLQRMIHSLLHGNLTEAWHANAFLLCTLPFVVFMVIVDYKRKKWQKIYKAVNSPVAIIIYCVAIAAWTIGRNL